MPFKKGQSGNPSGRSRYRTKDGRTLSELARDHTEEAVETLVEVMRNKDAPPSARVMASDKILNRGWGQAPQTINITDDQLEEPDLSGLRDDQIEALRTLRALEPLERADKPLH